MPTAREHREKARSCERALQRLNERNPEEADWVATIAFYAALHWVDGTLAQHAHHPTNHRERNRAAQRMPIWDDYHELYVTSRIARYEAGNVPHDVAQRMRDGNLENIRAWGLAQLDQDQ